MQLVDCTYYGFDGVAAVPGTFGSFNKTSLQCQFIAFLTEIKALLTANLVDFTQK